MITNYTKEDLALCRNKIQNDQENNIYKAKLPSKDFKYPFEDFVDLFVKGYTKQTIKLKTYCNYKPDTIPIAILFIFHGLGGHSNIDSAHIANYLVGEGYFVCSLDHREHGLSENDLGYVRNFSDLIDDASKFILLTEIYIEQKFNIKIPKFMCGSSMGGMIAHYVSKLHNFQGIIYNAPCFNVAMKCFPKMIIKSIACMCPGSNIPRSYGNLLSKNPMIIDIRNCPIMTARRVRFGTLNSLLQKCQGFSTDLNKSHEKSFVIIAGGVDKLVSLDAIINYYENSNVEDKSIWLYPNMWHVSFLEVEVYDIMPRLNIWMKKRLNRNKEMKI